MQPTILHVEDSADDALLVSLALGRQNVHASIQHVTDGQQAIDYLLGTGPYSDRTRFPYPALILLDLQLPKVNGFEVLSWMRCRLAPAAVPVLVLSSSNLALDKDLAMQLGAAEFLTKQYNFAGLGAHVSRYLRTSEPTLPGLLSCSSSP